MKQPFRSWIITRQTFGVTAIVASIFFVNAPAQANLIINGGFEDPVVVGTYEHRNGAELPGWTLHSTYRGTVQFSTLYDPVTEGAQAVQIEVPGDWISQTIPTIIGENYTVTFDLSAYSVYGGPGLGYLPCPCVSILEVTAGPVSATVNGSSSGYTTHLLDFKADALFTTVKFENVGVLGVWGNYPQIDNVSLTGPLPVSEPISLGLMGLGLVGICLRRRKQAGYRNPSATQQLFD